MELHIKIIFVIIFLSLWGIVVFSAVLLNSKLKTDLENEYKASKFKSLYLIGLYFEGVFVLLRLKR